MPKRISTDEEKPRRRRAATAVAIEPERERGLIMRVLLHSPKDTVAGAAALGAVVAIMTNALFLQAGRHPSPMFGTAFISPAPISAPLPRVRPAEAEPRPTETMPVEAPAPVKAATPPSSASQKSGGMPAHRVDPVGDLINSTRRITAVQRALAEFGYGQVKVTGVMGPDTQAAIQKFEKDRKLPITGQLSDRLIRDLVVLTGRPIE
ncbi:peptidoglycan-binding protein [Bradyrhizobium sp. SYSU BS000235]|uniref:peptidoglycan-binding protein n=1 Tax=Bradyrhizobium sp. SYSU BS000235 TaxID=3411332 RepID=UPI003C74E8AA